MYCKNCGEEIKEGADFCPNCGIAIINNGAQRNNSTNSSKDKAKRVNKKTQIIIGAVMAGLIILSVLHFGYYTEYKRYMYNRQGGQTRDEIEKTDITIKNLKADEINIGDYITFGRYEQDNNLDNGAEAIEWCVLDKATSDSGGRECILVISRYALDCLPYNEENENVTWETCDIREWLNNEFYYGAFSEDERNQLLTIKNNNPDASFYDSSWSGKGGNATSDNVFLLSYEQAESYFENADDRECYPTDYAMWNGADANTEHHCYWWLRSPGYYQDVAMGVSDDGGLCNCDVFSNFIGVRPTLWIYVD